MKRLYFAIGVVVIITAIILSGTLTVKNADKDMKKMFSSLQECVKNNDFDKAEKICDKAEKKWVEYEKSLSFFVNHAEVCDIGVCISAIKPLIKNRQKGDVLSELNKAETLLTHLANLENIKNK